MTIRCNGLLTITGVGRHWYELEKIFKEQFGGDTNEFGDDSFNLAKEGSKYFVEINEAPGDIDDQVREFVKRVNKHGMHVAGDYKFYGDYDGFSQVRDNVIETSDIEYYALFCGEDKELIEELKRRGYTVTKNNSNKKKNKKEKKQ